MEATVRIKVERVEGEPTWDWLRKNWSRIVNGEVKIYAKGGVYDWSVTPTRKLWGVSEKDEGPVFSAPTTFGRIYFTIEEEEKTEIFPVLTLQQQRPPQFQRWWDYVPGAVKEAFMLVDAFQRVMREEELGAEDFLRIAKALGIFRENDLEKSPSDWKKEAETIETEPLEPRPNDAGGYYNRELVKYRVKRGVWEVTAIDLIDYSPWQVGGNSGQVRNITSFLLRFIG